MVHNVVLFCAVQEFRAFELLRSGRDRSRYLLIKEAKIIAMTCTHAALKRRDLVEAGFQYDNILMEESAQILEIETFIPLLLQVCVPVISVVKHKSFLNLLCTDVVFVLHCFAVGLGVRKVPVPVGGVA